MAKKTSKLGHNIPHKWLESNRRRFDAETTIAEGEPQKCKHYFIRKTATQIGCKHCGNGWIDMGKWNVVDGGIKN